MINYQEGLKAPRNTGSPRLPLALGIGYLLVTYALFFLGPWAWPVENWTAILVYIPLVYIILTVSYLVGSTRDAKSVPYVMQQRVFIIGAIAALVLLIPSSRIYTGRWPWQLLEALSDQKEAYMGLAEALEATAGGRGVIAFIRSLAAPFVFAVLPLGILYWKRLNWFFVGLLAATVMTSITFSILRGTTRELADLLIVGSSAAMVAMVRHQIATRISVGTLMRQYLKAIIAGAIALLIVIFALVGRVEGRLGGTSEMCIPQAKICADFTSPPYNALSDKAAFGLGTVAGYFTQGYYAVSLAMEIPFQSTYGLGHSPALQALYYQWTGDRQVLLRAYSERLRWEGWPPEVQWASLLVWIANDLGFPGALLFIALMGYIWGRSWVDATRGGDDRAAIFFCVMMMMVYYLPSNNQLMLTFDNYAIFVFWGLSWGLTRISAVKIGRGQAVPA